MSNEFDIIQRYFTQFPSRDDVCLGIGDDAAVTQLPTSQELVITVDTLVAGVHFPDTSPARSIGHKSLAVNLSDLAAMGATPKWFTLAVTLPEADENWLEEFTRGLQELAARHRIALIGGDTTRGPLTITIQAMGTVPVGYAIKRSGARPGDDIYVTGTLGDAGLGLATTLNQISLSATDKKYTENKLNFPQPRVQAGSSLLTLATSMIDCSDGFVADLGHILKQSRVAAEVQVEQLPISTVMRQWVEEKSDWSLPLAAGDDFELIFTASRENRNEIAGLIDTLDCSLTCVGSITDGEGLLLRQKNGQLLTFDKTGYLHFE